MLVNVLSCILDSGFAYLFPLVSVQFFEIFKLIMNVYIRFTLARH